MASRYAAFRPRYPEQLFQRLASLTPDRSLVWDCGTGSGQAATALARHFERVLATDASRAQVAVAATKAGLLCAVCRAEESALRSGSAALVTVAQALHWFDLELFYPEVCRVLSPGGVFAAWSYGRHVVNNSAIDRELDRFYSDTVGPFWPAERRIVENGYRGIEFPFTELAIESPPLTAEWTLDQMLEYIRTWSAVQRYQDATGEDPMTELAARLLPLWGDSEARRRVEWPLVLRVGR